MQERFLLTRGQSSFFAHPMRNLLLAASLTTGLCGFGHAAPVLITQDFNTCANVAACGATVTFVADGTANSVNLRAASNVLNTAINNGFGTSAGGFFSSRFLAIGDIRGGIGGEPNGQFAGGLSRASFGLGNLGPGSYSFDVAFDYVFDSNNANNPDDFLVRFETAPGAADLVSVFSLLSAPQNSAANRGTFAGTFSFSLAAASGVGLAFSVQEFNGNGSSAAGIDNLRIRQIPEPGSLALAGLALFGLAGMRRMVRASKAGVCANRPSAA